MIECTNCGAIHPDDAKFCDQCGEDLVIKCHSCGATARPTAKFCPKCRNRLNGNASEEKIFKDNVIAGDVNASTSTTIVTNNYGPSFTDFDDARCSECGEIIPARLKLYNKCNDCGKYFCNNHLRNQLCQSCEDERLLTPFIFEKRANNKYAIIRLKNLHEVSVIIPSFVECIEDGAFEGSDLIEIKLHQGLVKIGKRAFANCKDLTEIGMPESVRVIGDEAFYGCANLLNAEIRLGARIGVNAFCGTMYDDLRMKKKREEEARKAEEARRLREAEEARRIREAEERRKAEEARMLREAEEANRQEEWATFTRTFEYEKIPNSNTYKIITVKDETITSVTIPEFVSEIANFSFFECSALTSVTIPNGVTHIGDFAFQGCISLANITIPNSVTSIGKGAFIECCGLRELKIPNSVTSIGYGAFVNCQLLESIQLPFGITSIGESFFDGCSLLDGITIPDCVTTIEEDAFRDCLLLESINIPRSVANISKNAFINCPMLTRITFEGTVAEWNAITFGKDWNYNIPTKKVICSNGTVQLS